MDQAILPQEYQTGSDSKRENLCRQDSERITKTTPRASNSWATGSGWSIKLLATGWYRRSFKCTENSSSSKHWRKYIKKLKDPAKICKLQNEELHEHHNQILDNIHARIGLKTINKIHRSTLSFSQTITYGLHLGSQRITKTSKKDSDE